jgi:tetratricopeptide (TPR) repeat protein
MRTQADYHFAVAEAFSFEGKHQKSIESLKMVLIYDQSSAQVHLRLAAEYVKLGMLSEALEHAELAIGKNPNHVEAHLLLGGLYSSLKNYKKALASYQKVQEIDPENQEVPLYIGAIYAEQKQYAKAIRHFQQIIAKDQHPQPHLIHYYLGRIYLDQGGAANENLAEASFKKALERKPNHFESVMARAALAAERGRPDQETEILRVYQRDYGPDVRVAEILSQKYIEEEKYELAIEQLEILEAQSPDALNVKVRLALVLIELKKFQTASEKLSDILRVVPESDKIRFYLAAVYEEMKNYKEALVHFKRVPASSSYYGEAILHGTHILKTQGKQKDALDLVKQAIGQKPDLPQLYPIYASLVSEPADVITAIQSLEKAAQRFPDHIQIHFFLGTLYDKIPDKAKVVAAMEKVIELDSNHVQGLNYLAFTLAEKEKDLPRAEELARKALALDPQDGYIMDTVGWILYKKGETKEAIKYLEAAHRLIPNESIVAEHLGDAYRRHALNTKAKEMYLRAVANEIDDEKIKEIRAKISSLERQELNLESSTGSNRQPASVVGP